MTEIHSKPTTVNIINMEFRLIQCFDAVGWATGMDPAYALDSNLLRLHWPL